MSDAAGYDVHAESLEDFARELEAQLETLRIADARLASLSDVRLRVGHFREAYDLAQRHRSAVDSMDHLLRTVRQAVDWARDVTRHVKVRYEQADADVAGSIEAARGREP